MCLFGWFWMLDLKWMNWLHHYHCITPNLAIFYYFIVNYAFNYCYNLVLNKWRGHTKRTCWAIFSVEMSMRWCSYTIQSSLNVKFDQHRDQIDKWKWYSTNTISHCQNSLLVRGHRYTINIDQYLASHHQHKHTISKIKSKHTRYKVKIFSSKTLNIDVWWYIAETYRTCLGWRLWP